MERRAAGARAVFTSKGMRPPPIPFDVRFHSLDIRGVRLPNSLSRHWPTTCPCFRWIRLSFV